MTRVIWLSAGKAAHAGLSGAGWYCFDGDKCVSGPFPSRDAAEGPPLIDGHVLDDE